eukprot:s2748_g5.t1
MHMFQQGYFRVPWHFSQQMAQVLSFACRASFICRPCVLIVLCFHSFHAQSTGSAALHTALALQLTQVGTRLSSGNWLAGESARCGSYGAQELLVFIQSWQLSPVTAQAVKSLPANLQRQVLSGFSPKQGTRNVEALLHGYIKSISVSTGGPEWKEPRAPKEAAKAKAAKKEAPKQEQPEPKEKRKEASTAGVAPPPARQRPSPGPKSKPLGTGFAVLNESSSEPDEEDDFSSLARDRVAAVRSHEYQPPPLSPEEDPSQHPSGFTSSGWDKYYFFSDPANCSGPGKGGLHPTARLGRNRPAMNGPQTFTIEAFSPEELAFARKKIEKKGARTSYTEAFSQFPRNSTAILGPIERATGPHIMKHAAATGQSVSDTLSQAGLGTLSRSLTAPELMAGPLTAHRMGPHWPPPGPERPDPLKTRQQLMAMGPHRTFVELHAKDRKAPGEYLYTAPTLSQKDALQLADRGRLPRPLAWSPCVCPGQGLLNGQHVVCVRAEDINISGSLYRNKLKYAAFKRKHMNSNPRQGPFHYRAPSKILWRTIRGMVPHKTARGAAALDRLKTFEGIPHPYDRKKRMVLPSCLKVLRLRPERRFCRLGDLSKEVGWKHGALIERLESQRKVKSEAFHKKKVAAKRARSDALKAVKLSAEDQKALEEAGYA